MTPYEATQKAKAIIHNRPTKKLIADFELTEKLPYSMEIVTVRGWIMDELESRNLTAYESWIDSADDSPRKYFFPA